MIFSPPKTVFVESMRNVCFLNEEVLKDIYFELFNVTLYLCY